MALVSQRSSSWLAALAISCSLLIAISIPISGFAQSQPDSASKRRVVVRTAPAYPSLARNMALTGLVRVDVLVTPEGSAKTVEVRGGHPVLAQAVVNAVRNWKWEPAAHESREPVEVKFAPE
jgi:TonB family protein